MEIPHNISLTPEIEGLVASGSPVAIGVSGGKDSQAAALATFSYLDRAQHSGPRILIHADLGSVEWSDSLRICKELATHFGRDLVVVRRKAGGLMERWKSRWLSSKTRYESLSTVTLVPCWSTPAMRFCTSEQKTHVIMADLKRRFKGQKIINVTGVRREESAARSRMPPTSTDTAGQIITWRPIIDHTVDEVFGAIHDAGLLPHPAYREFGMSRVSCRFCIMSNLADLQAAALQPESQGLLQEMVDLEIESSFAFQGSRWLGDIAPEKLSSSTRHRLKQAQERAIKRKSVEATLTKAMLFTKGWPERMLTDDEAALLCNARNQISKMYGFASDHLTVSGIQHRYAELLAEKSEKNPKQMEFW
ncbi:hypothetical protein GCM10019059_36550 [Camelimonas fluminis]|uniref:Phosphoadenosine phosphosulfate reductase family protein n=1 Tax=Camelimonas fluminis TaxID=1576911 RepID=A0ABV7UCD9_9HYPH|nr:phosphoadenosine phosphosulfate reductase family protein [Camelimonas fluminis]GHE73679.1 hypothetical protein GCM10019059_36550 [Camelimonas fluminis]